jgi:hypothetical protein
MDTHLVKTDNPEFMKDEETGALVSSDLAAFNKFKAEQGRAEQLKIQKNDLNNIKSDVSNLKSELGEVKNLLKQLLKK